MLLVLLDGVGEHDEVVEVHKHEVEEVRAEDALHHALERGGSVGEAHRHHDPLVATEGRADRRLVYVVGVHEDLPIPVE